MDGGSTEADRWREIAAQKEKEWKQATEQRLDCSKHHISDMHDTFHIYCMSQMTNIRKTCP